MQQGPLFEKLFHDSVNAYALLDPGLTIRDANSVYLALIRRGPDELLGGRLEELFTLGGAVPPLSRQVRRSCTRVLERGEPDVLVRVPCPFGDAERFWRIVHVPLFGAHGEVVAILQSLADDSELQALGRAFDGGAAPGALAAGASQAEDATPAFRSQRLEAIGKLTAGVAHDFNNMLQVIGGNLQLLRRNLGADEAALRRLDAAVSGVEKGNRLATRLLAFASRPSLEPQPVRLDEMLAQTLELLEGSRYSLRIGLELGADPWPVLIDAASLEGLLLDLLLTALEAVGEGGRLSIRLDNCALGGATTAAVPGEHVLLSLGTRGDEAAGHPRPDIFAPSWARVFGLDLDRLYALVERSGGFIERGRGSGSGASLAIYLPRHLDEGVGAGAGQGDAPVQTESPDDGLKVLFVEDDPTLRMLTGEVMAELGHRVTLSESAEEALLQLDGQRFDVLFTDIGLAGMSGIELVRQARAAQPRLDIVVASGYAVDLQREGLEGVRTLLKPYDIQGVREALAQVQAARADGVG